MDPLDELDPLAAVFPEDDGLPPGGSAVDGRAATPAPERQALGVAFPVDALLAPVFRAFEQAGVRWCLLRLPEDGSSPGGEVVALVDRSALSEASNSSWNRSRALSRSPNPGFSGPGICSCNTHEIFEEIA